MANAGGSGVHHAAWRRRLARPLVPPDDGVAVISTVGVQLDQLIPEWTALAAAHGRTFYGRPWYSLSWWAKIGRGELAVFCVRRNGRLVALAPLHRRRLLGQEVLRLLGHGLGTIGEVLVEDAAAAQALWDAVADDGAALQLTHVRPADVAILALRRHPRWSDHIVIDDRCPVMHLPPGATARDLRGQQTLRRLARYRASLERAGTPFAVEVVDDTAGLQRRWPDMVRVAAAADAGRDRLNLFAPPWAAFSRSFLEGEAANGTLLIIGATVGGRWVAHEVGFRRGSTSAQWVSRFDPAYTTESPGHLIREWLVDHHDELGLDTIDSLLGESTFKMRWTRDGYDVATVTAAPTHLSLVRARLAVACALGNVARRWWRCWPAADRSPS